MKIIFCDNSLKELINFRGEIINHFINKGDEIVMIAPNNIPNFNSMYPKIKLYDITLQRSGMNPFKDLTYLFKLIIIYLKEKPDLIFHYTIKPNIYGSIASKVANVPSVSMIAGLGYAFNHDNFKSKIARLFYKLSMRYPVKIFILNQNNLDILLENRIITKEKAILLSGGEGINLENFK